MKRVISGIVLFFISSFCLAEEVMSSSPQGARAYIISPQDGDVLRSPVSIRFGLSGMGVAPAGIKKENTGHHHLLINMEELPDLEKPLAATDQIRHFGKGQTETSLDLKPGKHTLRLLLGNFAHIPHNPPVVSDPITITVK